MVSLNSLCINAVLGHSDGSEAGGLITYTFENTKNITNIYTYENGSFIYIDSIREIEKE